MLNIAKFQNNFKVTIQGGIKMVNEWTKEGEGKFCQYSGMEYYNGKGQTTRLSLNPFLVHT